MHAYIIFNIDKRPKKTRYWRLMVKSMWRCDWWRVVAFRRLIFLCVYMFMQFGIMNEWTPYGLVTVVLFYIPCTGFDTPNVLLILLLLCTREKNIHKSDRTSSAHCHLQRTSHNSRRIDDLILASHRVHIPVKVSTCAELPFLLGLLYLSPCACLRPSPHSQPSRPHPLSCQYTNHRMDKTIWKE